MAWVQMNLNIEWGTTTPASGYVLKAYLPGTTTSTSMAIDADGGSLQASITTNSAGKFEVSGNEILPFIDREHKWALFANSVDAAANTPAFAGFYDNIPIDGANADFQVTSFAVARAKTSSIYSAGDVIHVSDDGVAGFFVVKVATVTDDGGILIVFTDDSNKYMERRFSGHVSIEWYGAVGDDSTNNNTAITAAFAYCATNDTSLFIPAGTFVHTAAFTVDCPMTGLGRVSILKNTGSTGSLIMDASTTDGYYRQFENFYLKGNTANSGIGFHIKNNNSYMRMLNVDIEHFGSHGLHYEASWAMSFVLCKFQFNEGIGIWLEGDLGADVPGGPNSMTFDGCSIRWNGGSNTSPTAGDTETTLKGGLRMKGGDVVNFNGGVIESNHPWGVVVEDADMIGSSNTKIVTYSELNGIDATTGGYMHIGAYGNHMTLGNSSVRYGSNTKGKTNYGVFKKQGANVLGAAGPAEDFIEDDQVSFISIYTSSEGVNIAREGVGYGLPFRMQSEMIGDFGGAGAANTYTLCNVTDELAFMINIKTVLNATSTGSCEVTELMAGRNYQNTQFAAVCGSHESATVGNPTISWVTESIAITGITLGADTTFTVASHAYQIGDDFFVSGIVGTTELNGRFFKVKSKSSTTVVIENGSASYTAWSSAGTLAAESLRLVIPANAWGFIEMTEAGRRGGRAGTETPTNFQINDTTFPAARNRFRRI